jgi:hypothetical protein
LVNGLGSVAGIITALTSLVVAIGGLLVSIKVLIPLKKTAEITHQIVNQKQTDSQAYQQDLRSALQEADVPIPPDKSLPEVPDDATA